MGKYLDFLTAHGMAEDTALMVIEDYLSDGDWDGLESFCGMMEENHVEELQPESVR